MGQQLALKIYKSSNSLGLQEKIWRLGNLTELKCSFL